jgi:tetratricopeptide (TPR) repeat protein
MPLGLALAASWLESLSPRAISREVQQDIDFLVTDMGDVPRRQRSLRAAFNHSWRLLSTREREIFCQMSIFRGGFTRAAAQAVTGATLRDLQALVNKSLLTLTADRRYDVHELLRQYGAEKLAEDGERETAVRDRHSTYYCQTLGEKEGDVRGQRGFIDPAEIGADLGNIEAAWRWAVQRRLWSNLHQASYPLFRFYKWSFRYQDSLPLYQLMVEQLAPGNMTEVEDGDAAWILARVLIWMAFCYLYLEQWRRVERPLQQSLTLLQSQALAQADTRRDKAFLFFIKGMAALPDYQAALDLAQKSLVLSRASGDQWQEAESLRLLGDIYEGQSNVEMAQKSLEDALIVYRSHNDTVSIATVLEDMGNLARNVMDYQRSEALYKESLALFRSQGYQPGIAGLLWALGRLKVFLGEFESGADYLQQAAEVQRENGYLRYLVPVMANLANVHAFSGHLLRARQCIEESLAIAEAISFPSLLQSVLAAQARINIWMGRYEAAQITVSRIFSFLDETAKRTGYWYVTSYGPISWLALAQSNLVTARENLQKVVDDNRQFDASESREWSAIYQATLSRAEWGLGQQAAARQHLYEALAVAVKSRAFITLLHVLPIAPIILAAEDDVCQKIRAIEIYALAHSHPFIANCQFFYDIAGKEMEAVEAELPVDVVTAAKARGQALDFWETAESLLTELQELGWNERGPAQP